jgi:hypothetical protein
MAILGMVGTESLSTERFTNIRRKVFELYPNGSAPLLGILSLMDEEETNDPEFKWYESRYVEQRTLTVSQGSSKGPFKTAADGDAGDTALEITAETEYIITVASSDQFRDGHVILIRDVDSTGGTLVKEIHGIVTSIPSTTKIKFRCTKTVTAVDNGTTDENVGIEVLVVGSAFAQGSRSGSREIYTLPDDFYNYCQIFKTPFSMTGTALKTAVKYDDSGDYKRKAKKHSVDHMIEIERAFLFGERTKYVDSSSNLPTYTTGGILWFLRSWEAGDYGSVTVTSDASDDKRIIDNTAGTFTINTYEGYLERLFRRSNNESNEKLVLCGNTALLALNRAYRDMGCLNMNVPVTESFGMNVITHVTPFGTVHYKTHPLFNVNAELRKSMLFVDPKNLKYRCVTDRDTKLLKNRQENDADYRKDEWLGECGLELQVPESFMFIKNVSAVTVS